MKTRILTSAIAALAIASCSEKETEETTSTEATRATKSAERIEPMTDRATETTMDESFAAIETEEDIAARVAESKKKSEEASDEIMKMMDEAANAPVADINGVIIETEISEEEPQESADDSE